MGCRTMDAIVYKRLRNEGDLVPTRDPVTEIPVFTNLLTQIKSAHFHKRRTTDHYKAGRRKPRAFPKQQIISDSLSPSVEVEGKGRACFAIEKSSAGVHQPDAILPRELFEQCFEKFRLHNIIGIYERDQVTRRFRHPAIPRRADAGVCLANILNLLAEHLDYRLGVICRSIIHHEDLRWRKRLFKNAL